MCKRLLFLISLCLVLGLVSNSFAEVFWTDDDPCDHLWRTPENWTGDAVPTVTDAATHNDGDIGDINGPVIDVTHVGANAAVCESFRIGNDPNCDMNIIGGTMYCSRFFSGVDDLDGIGTVNMSDGVVTCQFMGIAWKALGYLNMTGGTINITTGQSDQWTTAGLLAIPGHGGEGYVNLYGGTINCQDIAMAPYAGGGSVCPIDGIGRLDLKGDGKLVIKGDKIWKVMLYINNGLITGDGDPRFTNVQYVDGNTTVTYDDNPDLTVAWGARPLGPDAPLTATLVWSPGCYASDTGGHHVYFGTSWSDVNSGAGGTDKGIQDANHYPISGTLDLEVATDYFWRIDEVNDACDPCLWPGSVWGFSTVEHEVWDNFDQYASSAALQAVWQAQAGTGAAILRQTGTPRFPSNTSSDYGMKFTYDNAAPKYHSEVKRHIADAKKDWTRGGEGGIKELDLWFLGNKTNNTTGIFDMYAALEDKDGHIGVVYYGDHGEDINDVILQGHNYYDLDWMELPDDPEFTNYTGYRVWHIRLADFNENGDVNLADVNNFYLGFGDRTHSVAGGTGVVFFEEFRYYLPRCLAEYEPTIGDLTGDCTVNYEDLQIISNDWAVSDYNVATTNPTDANLLAYYKFEALYIDSSGNGRNGTAVNDVTIVYDATRASNVLKLLGTGDYVNCGGGKDVNGPNTWADVNGPITVAAWFKYMLVLPPAEHWMPIVCKGENAWRLQAFAPYGAYWGCTGLGEGEADWGAELTGGTYVNDGEWHHAAGVYNPNADGDGTGKVYLYVDGYLFDSHDANGMIQDGNDSRAAVTIGENLGDPTAFEGYIDEVRIYARALSQAQVAYLAGDGVNPLRVKPRSEANIYSDINNAVNFEDFALLAADNWLEEERLFGN